MSLFQVGESDNDTHFGLTPRLAARLWLALDLIADEHHLDPETHEDRLPAIALNRGRQFTARISLAAGELREDIAQRNPPCPRCTRESVVLGWALRLIVPGPLR